MELGNRLPPVRGESVSAAMEAAASWPRELLDALPAAVVIVEPDSAVVLFANRAALALTGEESPVGRPVTEWIPAGACRDAEGRPLTDDALPSVRAARGERVRGTMVTCPTSRGERTLRASAQAVTAPDGAPALLVSFEDVTELRAAQLGERLVGRGPAGDPRGRRRLDHRPGARRQPGLRQRGGRARARLPDRRGAALGAARGDHVALDPAHARGRAAVAGRAARAPRAHGRGARRRAGPVHRPRDQREALVAHQGQAGPRRRRVRAARHQRHRGRHRAQAGRAAAALPRRGEPRARRLARVRVDAGLDRAARGPGRGRLVRRRPRRRHRRASSTASRSRTSTRRR